MFENHQITLRFDELDLTKEEEDFLHKVEEDSGGVLDFCMRTGGPPMHISLRNKLCEKLQEEMSNVFPSEKGPADDLKRLRSRAEMKRRGRQLEVNIKL